MSSAIVWNSTLFIVYLHLFDMGQYTSCMFRRTGEMKPLFCLLFQFKSIHTEATFQTIRIQSFVSMHDTRIQSQYNNISFSTPTAHFVENSIFLHSIHSAVSLLIIYFQYYSTCHCLRLTAIDVVRLIRIRPRVLWLTMFITNERQKKRFVKNEKYTRKKLNYMFDGRN